MTARASSFLWEREMRIRIRWIASGLAAALTWPMATAGAQVGGMGGVGGLGSLGNPMSRGKTINMKREAGIVIPEQVNPVNLLVLHRGDLALSDRQFAAVISIKRTLDSTNSPLERRLDSLQRLFKGKGPLFGEPTPARRDSLAGAQALVRVTLGQLLDNIEPARDRAYQLLDLNQRAMARQIEEKADKALEKKKG
jgi:hypothetical protein